MMINCKGSFYPYISALIDYVKEDIITEGEQEELEKEKKRKYNYHVKKIKMFIGTQDKLNDLNCEVDDFLESVNGTVVYTDTKREKDGTIILTITYAIYPYRKK